MDVEPADITAWVSCLQAKKFKHSLDDTDFVSELSAVQERLRVALTEDSCPFPQAFRNTGAKATDDRRLANFYDTYLPFLREGDWYRAIYQFALCQFPEQLQKAPFDALSGINDNEVVTMLHKQWNGKYHGRSLLALKQLLHKYEDQWRHDSTLYYCKSLVIFQSSGTGKSRLASELGKEHLQVAFTFRKEGETGYPFGDTEITEFFNKLALPGSNVDLWIAAFLGAIGVHMLQWFTLQVDNKPSVVPQDLPSQWSSSMAPIDATKEAEPTGYSLGRHDRRSAFRKAFCKAILDKTRELFQGLGNIKNDSGEGVRKTKEFHELVVAPYDKLFEHMKRTLGEGSMFLLVMDEASNIPALVFPYLRRLLRLFRHHPMWAFYLSTYNSIQRLQPEIKHDPSARIREAVFQRHDPFLGLQLDIELNVRYANPIICRNELQKPLVEFSSADNLTLYGRPLWRLYATSSLVALRSFVELKLLGGTRSPFNPSNKDHVFAVLASRICLDPCLNNEESTRLIQTAVNSHLRIVVGMDQEDRIFRTITPSEPVVAHTAASLLMGSIGSTSGEPMMWKRCIEYLADTLLAGSLVEKGLKGEIYARIIFILTRDYLLWDNGFRTQITGIFDANAFNWSKYFVATDFLKGFLGPADLKVVKPLGRLTRNANEASFTSIDELIGEAKMAFNHFTSTDRVLNPRHIPQMLHDLLRQCAALQLAFSQPAWDLIVPMYYGAADDAFGEQYVSAIFIQIKNTKQANRLILGSQETCYFQHITQPVIAILMDLGTQSSSPVWTYIPPAPGKHPACLSLHIKGNSSASYGVLRFAGLEEACAGLLHIITRVGDDLGTTICDLNSRFNYHSRSDRFPGCFDWEYKVEDEEGMELDEHQ